MMFISQKERPLRLTAVTKRIKAKDSSDLRDLLPTSGVFDMLDCEVEIYCPELAMPDDIQRMVTTIESMINVVDVRVTATPETLQNTEYQVIITEVPVDVAKKFTRKDKEE